MKTYEELRKEDARNVAIWEKIHDIREMALMPKNATTNEILMRAKDVRDMVIGHHVFGEYADNAQAVRDLTQESLELLFKAALERDRIAKERKEAAKDFTSAEVTVHEEIMEHVRSHYNTVEELVNDLIDRAIPHVWVDYENM